MYELTIRQVRGISFRQSRFTTVIRKSAVFCHSRLLQTSENARVVQSVECRCDLAHRGMVPYAHIC